MAAQNTLSAITSFTHKPKPQLLKPAHLHTTLVPAHRHTWSVTTSDGLKWGSKSLKANEFFCKCTSRPLLQCKPEETIVKHAKLVELVREMTTNGINDIKFDDLLTVDALERLGLDYLYKDEMNLILEQCYLQFINKGFIEHRNLYEVSLSFRIFRQRGFRVSADAFELFKGKNGKFVENLKYDIRGGISNAVEQLPYYVKSSFKAVYDTTNEIAFRVYKNYGFNPIKFLRNSWATLFNAFLVEAKWFATRHTPKSEEYLKNGIISSGVQVFLVHMFFLLGDGDTKEKASLIDNNHEIVSSVSKIMRLSDDLESEQDENQDGHDGSYVKCLLMEHEYSSAKIAREYVKKMISDTWKCLTQECLSLTLFQRIS